MVETINRMRQATNQLVYQNGHEPTPEELAKAMDMSVERVREIQRMAQEPASLESPVGEEEDSSLGDFVADENAEAPGKAADRAMVAQQINQALKSLTPREEKVIRLRFGLDDGRPRTLEEVGKEFNVTRERIRQIEAKALRKLRHPSRAKLLRWCAANEGMDGRAAVDFIDCVRSLVADMLCSRQKARGMDRAELMELHELLDECAARLKVNAGVKHIFGLLAVDSIPAGRKQRKNN